MARFFFALWPGGDAARALALAAADIAPGLGGKPTPMEKIHLTLAFLGAIAPERVAAARDAADAVRGSAFELVLDRAGTFRRAGVAWAGPSRVDPALERLQESLARALRDRGFDLEARPFAPHVTLARRIDRALDVSGFAPVSWTVDSFELARSDAGTGRYTRVAAWQLA